MFPRGPRFEPFKVPDVPGPNAYNLDQDSQADSYKRGAFLEKADRFLKDGTPEDPIPTQGKTGSVKPTGKHMPPNPSNLADRYAILQRKVEDLERVHNEDKKSHRSEVDRLKLEVVRFQKAHVDQTDRCEKQRKQIEILDARVAELKKASATDQGDLKQLRAKLRVSEHERLQLASKQSEASELKKALQSLEAKRKDELRERDRKIVELDKALTGESKKRELLEARLSEIKGKENEEVLTVRALTRDLETRLSRSQDEAREARILQETAEAREAALLEELDQHQVLVQNIARDYGRLASSTIPLALHSRLKHDHISQTLQKIRLERKLANSEAQVIELANLIRRTQEESTGSKERVRQMEEELAFYMQMASDTAISSTKHDPDFELTQRELARIADEISDSHIRHLDTQFTALTSDFYRLECQQLLNAYQSAEVELEDEVCRGAERDAELRRASEAQSSLAMNLKEAQQARDVAQELHDAAAHTAEELRASSESMRTQLKELEAKRREDASRSAEALKKEKDVIHRLTAAIQQARMAENGLRAEVDQLTTELTDAERYQEAYYSLSDEVGSLVARNALAEDEAQRLSNFNAEILGHNNPAQRIMYVERIRNELAETKQKLVTAVREHETALSQNDELVHELDMYKSVMVPVESKSRTNITRVVRPPLGNLNQSMNINIVKAAAGPADDDKQRVLYDIPDMTLEEMM